MPDKVRYYDPIEKELTCPWCYFRLDLMHSTIPGKFYCIRCGGVTEIGSDGIAKRVDLIKPSLWELINPNLWKELDEKE